MSVKVKVVLCLQEEDLMVKVKEIVGHLEKLEEYQQGDGLRIQKMICDMYWDYTPIREMIADCMTDAGYAGNCAICSLFFSLFSILYLHGNNS